MNTSKVTCCGEIFNVTTMGNGPGLLCLHGYPQTNHMWHKIAPGLATKYSLIMPDLKGCGLSSAPSDILGKRHYSKRQMAFEIKELMRQFGHSKFSILGHDRGARVGYRLALDFPDVVEKLFLLDIITTYDVWNTMDQTAAMKMWHWSFLSQPYPLPEKLIANAPDDWVFNRLARGQRELPNWLTRESLQTYQHSFCQWEVICGTCADYRAGATIDFQHDLQDLERGRKIQCPVLLIYGKSGNLSYLSNIEALWSKWCDSSFSVSEIDAGHFLAEEAPEEVLQELVE